MISPSPKLLLIGLGDLGSAVLEMLAGEPWCGPIVAAGRDASRSQAHVNLARLAAVARGVRGAEPALRYLRLDLDQPGAVAEAVSREAPDIILSTATRQTWWLADLLPPSEAVRLRRARFGVWLPLHLTLTLKLMRALREAGYRGLTLTAPFPDVVHPVLGRLGLAPACGVGNVAEVAAKVRWLAAQNLHRPADHLEVTLVAHHALERWAFDGAPQPPPPHYLRVDLDGEDVTESAGGEALLRAPYAIPSGPSTCRLTAATIVSLFRALASDDEVRLHAPGPEGLPGGYPVIAGRGRIALAPVPGLAREEAIALNEAAQKFDGIERIEPDGTVVFCAEDAAVLRETLDYDAPTLKPGEAGERAAELMAKLRELARRGGVDLDRAWRAASLSR